MKKVLLYSGGTDSWLIKEIWKPDVLLYVDMNTRYSKQEIDKIMRSLSPEDMQKMHWASLNLGLWEDKVTAFIPMRNLYLLMVACNYGEHICMGVLKDDAGGLSDGDVEFLSEAEHMLGRLWGVQSQYEGKTICIDKQFTQYTKNDLIKLYLEKGGKIEKFKEQTFSCYSPTQEGKECLGCKACFRKFVACYGNGAKYSKKELEKIYAFAEELVVHRSHHAQGRYFLDKENGYEVLQVLERLYAELGKELNLN